MVPLSCLWPHVVEKDLQPKKERRRLWEREQLPIDALGRVSDRHRSTEARGGDKKGIAALLRC